MQVYYKCIVSTMDSITKISSFSYILCYSTANAAIMFKNGCLYNLYATNIYRADSPITIELLGEKRRYGLIQDMGYYELDGT